MNLIDVRQVITQILGFLILVWALRQWAFGPLMGIIEARREKIAGEFREADRLKAEAAELRNRYEAEMRTIEGHARQRMQEAIQEGQKVAAEIKSQAQAEAARRLELSQDEIAREHERAKEVLKMQMVHLSMRTAEKILRERLDEATQRRLVGEFIEEVGAPQ
jgi:F-type H+-transporting ATPase subunit b